MPEITNGTANSSKFELVDLGSGSLLGAYDTEDEALGAVVDTSLKSGEDAAITLALGSDDVTGQTDGVVIATGRALLELALARVRQPRT